MNLGRRKNLKFKYIKLQANQTIFSLFNADVHMIVYFVKVNHIQQPIFSILFIFFFYYFIVLFIIVGTTSVGISMNLM